MKINGLSIRVIILVFNVNLKNNHKDKEPLGKHENLLKFIFFY